MAKELWRRLACATRTVSAMLLTAAGTAHAAWACVDVALVLAVDGSSSVNEREFGLQRHAIAAALRDPGVLDAMRSAGTVSAGVIFWGDPEMSVQKTARVIIESPQDAERLARMVERMPRKVQGSTGLGEGVNAALEKLEAMGCAERRIVNVSGDGKETVYRRRTHPFTRPDMARSRARAADVTINALVISNSVPDLAHYYAAEVITGPGSFVMEIATYDDYAEAIRLKLIREIVPQTVSSIE